MKKKILSSILCLIFLFSFYGTAFGQIGTTIEESVCTSCGNPTIVEFAKDQLGLEAVLLDSDQSQQYINILNDFVGVKNLESKIDQYQVIKVSPSDLIFIMATKRNSGDSALYAVIDGKNKDILNIHFNIYNKDGSVVTRAYSNNGTFSEKTLTIAELNEYAQQSEQELLDFIQKSSDPSIKISIPTNWEYWCCKFAGFLACSLGCGVFIELPPVFAACKTACSYFWGNNICDDYQIGVWADKLSALSFSYVNLL